MHLIHRVDALLTRDAVRYEMREEMKCKTLWQCTYPGILIMSVYMVLLGQKGRRDASKSKYS